MYYKYSQLKDENRIDYMEASDHDGALYPPHLGQLKLLYSEILFLNKYAAKGDRLIYIGAAEGSHIPMLYDLFKHLNLIFDLYDPSKFKQEKRDNVNLYNEFFTDETVKKYKGLDNKKILMTCDMRNLEIAKFNERGKEKETDRIVIGDMQRQMKWVQQINPKASYLKFRLPYLKGYTEYFKGTVFLQPYSPASTEARIISTEYYKLKKYDNVLFDEKMAYFNFKIRSNKIPDEILGEYNSIFEKLGLKKIWDNFYVLKILDYYLRVQFGDNYRDTDRIAKLFDDILKFQIKYTQDKKKFNVIFEGK